MQIAKNGQNIHGKGIDEGRGKDRGRWGGE